MLLKKFYPVLLFLFICSNNVLADNRLTFGAKLLGAGWKGDNGTGGSDFESDKGGQFAINVSYKVNDFYVGLNVQRGEYEFDGAGPDRFSVFGRFSSNNVTIEQTDIDLLFGYYFWPQISLFIDIKSVTNDWKGEPYQQTFTGLGLGAAGYIPMNDRWTLFGSIGFIGENDIEDNTDNKVGEGTSYALEIGTVYTLNENNFLNFGVKTRNYDFEFRDSSKQEYKINALFFGYNYSFNL